MTQEDKDKAFMDGLKRKEDGSVDFSAMSPADAARYTAITDGADAALEDIDSAVAALRGEIDSLKEKRSKERDIAKKAELREKERSLNAQIASLEAVRSMYSTEEVPVDGTPVGTPDDSSVETIPETLKDNQGNPIDAEGKLILEKVQSVDELSDADFVSPTRNVQLPDLPENVASAIGSTKPVVIKKNVFEKNARTHKDLTPEDGRKILTEVLYSPNLYGQNQKTTRPYNWILIHLADKNEAVIVEVNDAKDNTEIVNWHYLRGKSLEQKKIQAINEGALSSHFLMKM